MSRVVYLHIGAPKTGTTYLQDRLGLNAREPGPARGPRPDPSPLVSPGLFHFRAALDLLGQDWGGPPGHAEGAWDALVRRVRRASGTVIISHEILAPGRRPTRSRKAMDDLADREVHVVYSARDLARQIPAAWQESIKQGRKWTYRRFLNRVRARQLLVLPRLRPAHRARHLGRRRCPPERVHVVTVPQRARRRRRATSCGCGSAGRSASTPPGRPLDSDRANRSLGVAETQVVRQLNRRMDRATRREAEYDELIREMLAQDRLVTPHARAPVRLPPERFDWAEERAERVDRLAARPAAST